MVWSVIPVLFSFKEKTKAFEQGSKSSFFSQFAFSLSLSKGRVDLLVNEVTLTRQGGIWSQFYKMWVNLKLKGLGGWSIRLQQRWHFIFQSQSLFSVYSNAEVVILSLWYHKHSHSNRLWCHEQRFIVLRQGRIGRRSPLWDTPICKQFPTIVALLGGNRF